MGIIEKGFKISVLNVLKEPKEAMGNGKNIWNEKKWKYHKEKERVKRSWKEILEVSSIIYNYCEKTH